MHFTTVLITSLALAALSISPITAIGINCDGSSLCALADWSNDNASSTIQILGDALNQSNKSELTSYQNGDHIICIGVNQTISIDGPKEKFQLAEEPEAGTIELPFSLDADLTTGGVCLFPQYMPEGAVVTLREAKPLVTALLNHGCKVCGSVPRYYGLEKSESPQDGFLTFNFVGGDVFCNGTCVGGDIRESDPIPKVTIQEPPTGEEPTTGQSAQAELAGSKNSGTSSTPSTRTGSKNNGGSTGDGEGSGGSSSTDTTEEDPPIGAKRSARLVHM